MASTILEMRDITKTFPGVKALSNVNLSVEEGEIHAVVGENGAGKSTLMKVLSGVYPSGTYDGQIIFRGQECHFKGIHDSEHIGSRLRVELRRRGTLEVCARDVVQLHGELESREPGKTGG